MAGRPTGFKPEYAEQVEKLCLLGATDPDIADFFGVSVWTIHHWKHKHPEFAEKIKAGKEPADDRVERSLYNKAVGGWIEVEKLFHHQGTITRDTVREYVPPDTVACIFWLKNRRANEWRDVHKHEVGKPGDFSAMSDDELNNFIAQGQGIVGVRDSGKEKERNTSPSQPTRRTH